ncbi:MAG: 16S rRNA (cytosine(1402)-N(4))-methyltransferase, partial [Parcubacteria group bacterium]|nr:16S rRNA (cytosine(1402)-N(4))-methyltransferase [Parcubacteria group bacterium]
MFRVLGYMIHTPVLLKEVIRYLNPRPNENFIDATFGGGGHALEILKRIAPKGKLLGLDWDPTSLGLSAKLRRASSAEGFKLETRSENLAESEPLIRSGIELGPFSKTRNDADGTRNYPSTSLGAGADDSGLIVECANFAEIENISREYFPEGVNGVLFDFGLRTGQLEGDEKGEKGKMNRRGFSYLKNEPLDMRFNMDQPLTASEIINTWPERELEIIFKDYGEEKNARKIAKAIVEARKQSKIETTGELVEIIGGRDIKTLARIFQALRIAVNNELENIRLGLEGAWRMLKPGGLASPSPSQGGPASPSPSQGGPASP